MINALIIWQTKEKISILAIRLPGQSRSPTEKGLKVGIIRVTWSLSKDELWNNSAAYMAILFENTVDNVPLRIKF